jgi:hypothetical protein
VLLTYLASAMGYLPAILAGFKSSTEEAPAITILAYMLAAPFLAATEAPIGLLIVGFGLWEAWKLTGGVPMVLGGPYRRTAGATGPPG